MPRTPLVLALVLSFTAPAVQHTSAASAVSGVAQDKGRKVAFLVGVGEFRHDLTNLGVSPQKDATELAKVLKDGGFEVVVLTDREATKAGVEERFKKLVDGKGSLAKGDLLVVAVCTHGFALPPAAGQPDQPFLAAHDSKLDRPDTMVSLNRMIADGKSSGATVLYLIDACRELPQDVNRGQTRGIEPTQVTLPKGTAVLFSCGRGQVSHQNERAGGGHGLFTYAVLKALKGEGGLKDEVSWSGLVYEVEQAFKSPAFKEMIPAGKPQTPFASAGELAAIDLMRVNPVEVDWRAYVASADKGEEPLLAHLRLVVPDRLAGWRVEAEKGNSTGQVLYGVCLRYGAGVAKNEAEAANWFRKAADAGNSRGMNNLAIMYSAGLGVAKDEAEAFRWYRKSAEAGELFGMNNIGQMYWSGIGVAEDKAEAVRWYRKAAAAGLAYAMLWLGRSHQQGGGGLTKDDAEAVRWYRKAAERGHVEAMNALGWMYVNGRGVAKDDAEGARWQRRAADAGFARAMDDLGWMYAEGRGVGKDDVEAVRWYRKAADAGLAKAMNDLGWMHVMGRGVAKNDVEGVRWFQKAAEGGSDFGMNNLGEMYEAGRGGLPKDRTKAIEWFNKAAAKGNEMAQKNLKRLNQK